MRRILLAVLVMLTSCGSGAVVAADTSAESPTSDASPTSESPPTTEEVKPAKNTSDELECPAEVESTIFDYFGSAEPTSVDNTAAGVAEWFMSSANSDWHLRRDWQRLTLDEERGSRNTFIYVDADGLPYLRLTAQQISGSWVVGDMSSCAASREDLVMFDEDFVPIPNSEGNLPFHTLFECGGGLASMEFLWELPLADENFPGMLEAIEPFVASAAGETLQDDNDWRVAHADEDSDALPRATLVTGDGESFTWMNLAMVDGDWRWQGSSSGGDCELRVVLADRSTVEWQIVESSPESPIVSVMASERACVGGQDMGDRLRAPYVTLTPDSAYILLTADPLPGDGIHTCPGNPSVAVDVDLGETLGDRQIRNTQTSMGWFSDFWPTQ